MPENFRKLDVGMNRGRQGTPREFELISGFASRFFSEKLPRIARPIRPTILLRPNNVDGNA